MLTVSTPTPSTPSPVHPGVYTPRERFIRLPEVLYTVIPPFFGALKSRGHAACAKRCFGV